MNALFIRGTKWKYQDFNQNKSSVVLLVHGHPFNHTMWKYQYKALDNFRLLVPDLKGYGGSDSNFEKIFIEEQALDLAILLDELKIEKIHLIGLSMGGQIIVEFQRLFPHRVVSMVICASLPNAESKETYKKRLKLADEITKLGMLEYTKNDIHKYINLEELKTQPDRFSHLFKMMSETNVQGAVASHKGRAERRDNSHYIKTMEVPTLVIAGEKDYFYSVDRMESLAQKIPNAQFEMIPNTGHLPNLEQPEMFNQIISNFYKKIK